VTETADLAAADATPYAGLTPQIMLDAVEAFCAETAPGLRCSGGFLALNSYENRVIAAELDGEFRGTDALVAKFYRPGRWTDDAIREEHAFVETARDAEILVVAPLRRLPDDPETTLFTFAGHRLALFPRRRGRAAEMRDAEDYRQMGRLLGRLHALGAAAPFRHRIEIDPETYGEVFIDAVADGDLVPEDLRDNYLDAAEDLLAAVWDRWDAPRAQRIHGDCHLGNVLVDAGGPFLVDFDDCGMGPAVQDLWMLTSGEAAESGAQFDLLLEGYRTFAPFDDAERALVEPLRALRMIRHNGWLAQRWADPAFPRAFPQAATAQYWQEQIGALRDQLGRMDDVPGAPARAADPPGAGPFGWEWEGED